MAPLPKARQNNNTAYLDSYWFSGDIPLTDQDMKSRVLELKNYHIKYQLADIGVLISSSDSQKGTLPESGYKQLARWIKITRETDPGQLIIVIVNDGNRVMWKNGKRVGNPNFGNAYYKANLKAVTEKLIQQGVSYNGKTYKADRIQFDIEGFLPNDPVLKETAQFVKPAVLGMPEQDEHDNGNHEHANNKIFSIATPADSAVWSDQYISEMSAIFNMLNPMMYDQLGWGSPVNSPETYQQFWKEITIRYAHVIANSSHPETRLNPTMPAYGKKTAEDGTVYHDPAIENIYNAAKGLQMAREQLEIDRKSNPKINKNGVHGSGIFWWSSFILQGPDPWDGYDYAPDRQWWMKEWVNQK